jgi:glycosyltransferase involved in cell wall biosynthesis
MKQLNENSSSKPEHAGDARKPVDVAVLVPCYNEETTIGAVVSDFKAALPNARIFVCDNNSTDATAAKARQAGAIVTFERRQGKGQVVRRMFADIEADLYILVDGDDTYDASAAQKLVNMIISEGYDLVNVARETTAVDAYRPGHRLGNILLTQIVRVVFGRETTDMLSGYKGLSRRFVKTFPALSAGFETETELTVHALELRMPIGEIVANYRERPQGSVSKLRTYRDGMRILLLIGRLIKDERPLQFFGLLGVAIAIVGLILVVPVLITYFETGLVPRLPTAVLSLGCFTLGALSVLAGIILDVVTKTRQEIKRLSYLSMLQFSRHSPDGRV